MHTHDAEPRDEEIGILLEPIDESSTNKRENSQDQVEQFVASGYVHHPASKKRAKRHRNTVRDQMKTYTIVRYFPAVPFPEWKRHTSDRGTSQ
jgi:hypothetical protein